MAAGARAEPAGLEGAQAEEGEPEGAAAAKEMEVGAAADSDLAEKADWEGGAEAAAATLPVSV